MKMHYLIVVILIFEVISFPKPNRRLNSASLLQLRQLDNSETRSFNIRADSSNPSDTASISASSPGATAYATGTVRTTGGGLAESRSTITTSGGTLPPVSTSTTPTSPVETQPITPPVTTPTPTPPTSETIPTTPLPITETQPTTAPITETRPTPPIITTSPTIPTAPVSTPPTSPTTTIPTPPVTEIPSLPVIEVVPSPPPSTIEIPFNIASEIPLETPQLRNYLLNWTKLNFLAKDVQLTNKRTIYLVGLDSNIYLFDPNDKSYTLILENKNIEHIVIYYETLFTISQDSSLSFINNGMIYTFNTCAKDVSVSNTGEIYKLGCKQLDSGYGLYKLRCGYDVNMYTMNMDRFLTRPGAKCEWIYQNINAVTISIASNVIYTINDNSDIVYYVNGKANVIPNIKAIDISVTKFGVLYVVDKDNKLYILNPTMNYTPKFMMDNVEVVSPGVLSVPIYIDTQNNVYVPNFIMGNLE